MAPTISVVAHVFYDFDKSRLFMGGAEIYMNAVIELILKHYPEHQIEVIQVWDDERVFKLSDRVIIKTVPITTKNFMIQLAQFNWMWPKYRTKGSRVIFGKYMHAFPFCFANDIVVCHGVDFDIPVELPTDLQKALQADKRPGSKFMRWFGKQVLKFSYYYFLQRSKCIVSVDYYTKKLLYVFRHQLANNVKVIHSFVDTQKFFPTNPQPFQIPKNRPIQILFPRNLTVPRGCGFLIDVAKYLIAQNIDFRITTIGSSYLDDFVKRQITANQLDPYFDLKGMINHQEMPKFYNQADIVMVPTLYSEGASLSALEAMACRKPIVVTDIGGLTDIVVNNYSGLVVPPDSQEIAKAIHTFIQQPQFADSCAQNAYDIVQQCFTKHIWDQKYLEFFKTAHL